MDKSVLRQVIKCRYIWMQYFLHYIVQLIPLLINFNGYLYISVVAYAND